MDDLNIDFLTLPDSELLLGQVRRHGQIVGPNRSGLEWSRKDKLNYLLRTLKRIVVRIPLETSLHSPLLTKSNQSNSFALISAQVLPILLNHHRMAHKLRVVSPGLDFTLS